MLKTPVGSGIITNYNCTAACRHCMFASSPDCKKEYISEDMCEKTAELLVESGAYSVHIGGGEPFMNFDALCTLISVLGKKGIGIDYIETNGFWGRDEALAHKRLERLAELGSPQIMVSVDPFHIEYVPLSSVINLCNLLTEYGFDYFVWQRKFFSRLTALDTGRVHTKEEISAVLGDDYIEKTAVEYGLGINGRALSIAPLLYKSKTAEELATTEKCPSLTRPNHCHFDLYGKAIPSRCTGLSVDMRDYLTGNITFDKYPAYYTLVKAGLLGLYRYGLCNGFVPDEKGYPTRCALCYAIRKYLFENCPSEDLGPESFYLNMK